MKYQRDWDGIDWQNFSRRLVQLRHGATNVQNIPDKVKGDAGLEFYTLDGCCYQSYAPEETANVAKAASAMKQKASRDLRKLKVYATQIEAILGTVKIKRWILLCPFLDDKAVIAHVHKKAKEVREAKLPFIENGFQALVHSQEDFEEELCVLRQQALGLPLIVATPTDEDILAAQSGINAKLEKKLKKAFPADSTEKVQERIKSHAKAHLLRENSLDALREFHPQFWEKIRRAIDAEERRLETLGAGPGAPQKQLRDSLERLELSLGRELPGLENSTITTVANGTLSNWLIECPLDFN